MPPRSHSSSSARSSVSRSSHSSRTSHSSRPSGFSRTSSRTSSAPSRHSSSSLLGTGTRFGGEPSKSSKPSAHANSSYRSATPTVKEPSAPGYQPKGGQVLGALYGGHVARQRYHGARHHDSYGESWTDSSTDTESRTWHDDAVSDHSDHAAFQEIGKSERSIVVCHCPYCGQDTIMNLDRAQGAAQSLLCPYCNGTMEIASKNSVQAEYKSKPITVLVDQGSGVRSRSNYDSVSRFESPVGMSRNKYRRWTVASFLIIAGIIVTLLFAAKENIYHGNNIPEQGGQAGAANNEQPLSLHPMTTEEMFTSGVSAIYLELNEDGSFHVVNDAVRADKFLYYDQDTDCYYDSDSDCYVCYNTDVYPHAMQYWYEGISSDYGDYGWMEYYDDSWHIEVDEGRWTDLPSTYDPSSLWHVGLLRN